jgi:hypothetical protein
MDKIVSSTLEDFKSFKHKHVEYYEGVEGVKKVFEDTLKSKTHIFASLHPSEIDPNIRDWIKKYYVPKRVELGVFAYVFVSADEKMDEWVNEYISSSRDKARIVHRVKDVGVPFEMEINCYDDKVAFIQYNPKYPIYGIIVKHKPIANTIRSIFLNFLWTS